MASIVNLQENIGKVVGTRRPPGRCIDELHAHTGGIETVESGFRHSANSKRTLQIHNARGGGRMASEDDYPASEELEECREPSLEDLAKICGDLNECGAKYVVVGGFAIVQSGFLRHTMDIDLLVDVSLENERRVVEALMKLPDQAIKDMQPGDVDSIGVVRVADEVMVDLMKSGCGVTYADAIKDAVWRDVLGVRIPFASKSTLWKMKQTLRSKDDQDRLFLIRALQEEGITLDPPLSKGQDPLGNVPGWLKRLLQKIFG